MDDWKDWIKCCGAPIVPDIIVCFLWGSRSYGTHTSTSDYDVFAVVNCGRNRCDHPDHSQQQERVLGHWESRKLDITFVCRAVYRCMVIEGRHDVTQMKSLPLTHVAWFMEESVLAGSVVENAVLLRTVVYESKVIIEFQFHCPMFTFIRGPTEAIQYSHGKGPNSPRDQTSKRA
jgi:hypothetical protein